MKNTAIIVLILIVIFLWYSMRTTGKALVSINNELEQYKKTHP